MTAYIATLLTPVLFVLAGIAALPGPARSRRIQFLLGLAATVLLLFPWGGLPAGRWLVGLGAGCSVPTLAVLISFVAQRWCGVELLDPRSRLSLWLLGAATGAALYPAALAGHVGLYTLGWTSPWLVLLVCLVAIVLIVRDDRAGLVLALAVLANEIAWLESGNLWDCLVDPPFVLASLGALSRRAVAVRTQTRRSTGSSAA